ncbi:CGNR zinc finger domain-containing protein [Amycolatopsis anabasis]|uniref:CGNR zinc finger domain-containing protein n=1 Tax=Amycolatopsis anabasis TaxID=1840409 RepID=UPI00131A8BAB|nr:CGNR zinc finger domain-containing protein [Amycolatopsis anabasis]
MTAEWVFDGGRASVDLVNTLRDRKRGGRELLVDPAALGEWLTVAGLLERKAKVTARHLEEALQLRESADRLLRAAAAGDRPKATDVKTVNVLAAAVPPAPPQLRVDSDGRVRLRSFAPADPVAAALAALATDAIELAVEAAPVRICAATDCGLRFVDRSPKRNRQWCSMARCGNRAKARAHYARGGSL